MKAQTTEKVHFIDIPTTGDAICGCDTSLEISWTCDPFDVTCPKCRKVLKGRLAETFVAVA